MKVSETKFEYDLFIVKSVDRFISHRVNMTHSPVKFSHFHGLKGQLIGTLAYVEVDNQVTYSITKVSPKAKRPTRYDGRMYANESKHIATVHRKFFKFSISKKDSRQHELMKFLNLWLVATGKICLPKEIYGHKG